MILMGITSLQKELDVNNIESCKHKKLEENHQYSMHNLDVNLIKQTILQLNRCNH